MTSTRGPWIRFLLAGLSIAAAPFGFPSARGQGFGPDPFQPFNSQFQQFVYPVSPYAGGPGPAGGMGRLDNQYQQYLKELEGANRASTQRYGIGVQYWKMRSDIELDKRDRLNRRIGRQSEDTLSSISQKYLAYFSEDDPRKRAILMREFTPTRRGDARDGLARGEGEIDNSGAPPAPDVSRRPLRGAGGLSGSGRRLGSSSALRDSSKSSDETTGRSVPPPPPISRFSGGSGRTQRRPADVLDRAKRDSDFPGLRTRPPTTRRNRDQPAASPSDE